MSPREQLNLKRAFNGLCRRRRRMSRERKTVESCQFPVTPPIEVRPTLAVTDLRKVGRAALRKFRKKNSPAGVLNFSRQISRRA